MSAGTSSEPGRFKRYSEELGLLLWAIWNPIGVDVPLDEYDSYMPVIWRLLSEHAAVDDIAAELDRIADQQMGVSTGTSRETAERLTQWWHWRFTFPEEYEGRS